MSHSNDMAAQTLTEDEKKIFLDKYAQSNKDQFYNFLVSYATQRLNKGELQKPTPENELMTYYDKFLSLYRKENNIQFLEIAKTFRRAAHKTYYIMLEIGLTEKSQKFLNLVGE